MPSRMSSTINTPAGLQVQCTRRAPDFKKILIFFVHFNEKSPVSNFKGGLYIESQDDTCGHTDMNKLIAAFPLLKENASKRWVLPAQCNRVLHVILTITWDHIPREDQVAGLQMVTSSVYCEVRTEYLNAVWKNVMQQHLTSGRKHENVATLHLGTGPRVTLAQTSHCQWYFTLSVSQEAIPTFNFRISAQTQLLLTKVIKMSWWCSPPYIKKKKKIQAKFSAHFLRDIFAQTTSHIPPRFQLTCARRTRGDAQETFKEVRTFRSPVTNVACTTTPPFWLMFLFLMFQEVEASAAPTIREVPRFYPVMPQSSDHLRPAPILCFPPHALNRLVCAIKSTFTIILRSITDTTSPQNVLHLTTVLGNLARFHSSVWQIRFWLYENRVQQQNKKM